MNFLNAVKAMKNGKKVKRKTWDKEDEGDSFLFLNNGVRWGTTPKALYSFWKEDIESTDWEIFEEPTAPTCSACNKPLVKDISYSWRDCECKEPKPFVLADMIHLGHSEDIKDEHMVWIPLEDIKIFIQNIKKDIDNFLKNKGFVEKDIVLTKEHIIKIIQSRAGDL